ncbi:MAG: hypothetical protein P8X90_29695, partial [Desulfobacterales bacterium]
MKITKVLVIIFLMAAAPSYGRTAHQEHTQLRRQALKFFNDGNYKDAYMVYYKLCLKVANDPKLIGGDLLQAWYCLRNLNRLDELDAFREDAIKGHPNNWRLLRAAAGSYNQNNHWGYMVAGEFQRGSHRGGGRYANAIQRDRARALQLMNRALELTTTVPDRIEVADLYLEFGRIIFQYGGYNQAWRLQYLTDLDTLPDYESGQGYEYSTGTQGAPVDRQGRPVFYKIPATFESAQSDGERWRWLLAGAAELNPDLINRTKYAFASFLHQQFGVQTLAAYRQFFAGARSMSDKQSGQEILGPYDVHTLADNETLARLADGIKRFELPEEYNYIRLFSEIARRPDRGYASDALRSLARIYENRRLYDRAVDFWDQYKQYNSPEARQQIAQITAGWGIFETAGTQPSGRRPTVEYRFRNGTAVHLKAYRIRVKLLLGDVKAYIRSNPRHLDWNKIRIDDIGWRLVHENQTRYIGSEVADWDLKLEPDERHWDRRITIDLIEPLDQAGAYLLSGEISNGNTARIIVWVSDTTLIK